MCGEQRLRGLERELRSRRRNHAGSHVLSADRSLLASCALPRGRGHDKVHGKLRHRQKIIGQPRGKEPKTPQAPRMIRRRARQAPGKKRRQRKITDPAKWNKQGNAVDSKAIQNKQRRVNKIEHNGNRSFSRHRHLRPGCGRGGDLGELGRSMDAAIVESAASAPVTRARCDVKKPGQPSSFSEMDVKKTKSPGSLSQNDDPCREAWASRPGKVDGIPDFSACHVEPQKLWYSATAGSLTPTTSTIYRPRGYSGLTRAWP